MTKISFSSTYPNKRIYEKQTENVNDQLAKRKNKTTYSTSTSSSNGTTYTSSYYTGTSTTGTNTPIATGVGILEIISKFIPGLFGTSETNNNNTVNNAVEPQGTDNKNNKQLQEKIENTIGTGLYQQLESIGWTFFDDGKGNIIAKDANGNTHTLEEIKTSDNSSIEGDKEIDEILGGSDKNEISADDCEKYITNAIYNQGIEITNEVKEAIKNSIQILDSNGNNIISRDELKTNLQKAMDPVLAVVEQIENKKSFLIAADLNEDGIVDREEFKDFKESTKETEDPSGYANKNFDDLDKNRNGVIEKNEL